MSKTEPMVSDRDEERLEITDMTYRSEGSEVQGKIYRLKTVSTAAPAIVTLPGRGKRIFEVWSGCLKL